MARIAGINIPMNKHVWVGLTHIYGVGRARARDACEAAGVDPDHQGQGPHRGRGRTRSARRSRKFAVEGDLRREVSHEHQAPDGPRLLSRHPPPRGLPVRGQRTRTNARTRKGPRKQAVKLNAPPGKA